MIEMLQKTENVANNVVNENSQYLTEQWKKGELSEGWYYVKCDDGICFDRFTYYGGFSKIFNYSVKQILAPVPTFEEWKQLKEYERIVTSYNMKPINYDIACETVNKLLDEKNFLKEEISAYKRRIAELKELLKKANKFLKDYGFTFDGKDCAEAFKVHTKINEVLKCGNIK